MRYFQFYHKPEIYVLNDTVKDDLEYLNNLHPNDSPIIVGISQGASCLFIFSLGNNP